MLTIPVDDFAPVARPTGAAVAGPLAFVNAADTPDEACVQEGPIQLLGNISIFTAHGTCPRLSVPGTASLGRVSSCRDSPQAEHCEHTTLYSAIAIIEI